MMKVLRDWAENKTDVFLVVGDIVCFVVAFWLALIIFVWGWPDQGLIYSYLPYFLPLFTIWLVVFFMAGLYNRQILMLKYKVPALVFYSTVINFVIAGLSFYFLGFEAVPIFFVSIYFLVLLFFLYVWRTVGRDFVLGGRNRKKAMIIGTGSEVHELKEDMNKNSKNGFIFVSSIDLKKIDVIDVQEDIISLIYSEDIRVVGIDLQQKGVEKILPHLYNLIFSKVRFVDVQRLYEEFFERTPISALRYSWFLENLSMSPHTPYDSIKRGFDVILGILSVSLLLFIHPLVFVAQRFSGIKGSALIKKEYIGRNNNPITLFKFRVSLPDGTVPSLGRFLQKSGIERFPFVWSVVKGQISFIGPYLKENDLEFSKKSDLPFYTIRYIIRPGIWSWSGSENFSLNNLSVSRIFSYDLYYLKNHSLVLDLRVLIAVFFSLFKK